MNVPGSEQAKQRPRNSVVTALVVLAVLVVVGSAGVSAWSALDVREQTRLANQARQVELEAKQFAEIRRLATDKVEGVPSERAEPERKAKEDADLARQHLVAARDEAEYRVYLGKIALAQAEWERGDAKAAIRALDECRWDWRGWEHDYLWSMFHQNQAILNRHFREVRAVAFSPDGKLVASADSKGAVKVWDAVTGAERPDADKPALPTSRLVAVSQVGLRAEVIDGSVVVTDPRRPDRQSAVDHERLARWATPDPAYHRREADAAEAANQPFALVFHLQRLLDLVPEDADLRKRLADVRAKLKD